VLTFSVVINTYNRADGLKATLKSLLCLDYPDFEIVVVNGPSTDHTQEVLEFYAERIKTCVCPKPNLSMSRNIGICAAAGDIIAFIDDDAIPEPEWLNQLAEAFDSPMVAAAGGKVMNHTGYEFQYQYSTADRLGNAQWNLTVPTPELNFPDSKCFPYLQGTNTAFCRKALLNIGGFDEEYEFYLDETDVCARLVDAGYLVRQLPNAYVHHKFLPSHLRDENRVTKHRYPIIKNKIYFSLRNGRNHHGMSEIIADAQKFIAKQAKDLKCHIRRGLLSVSAQEAFHREVDQAWETAFQASLSKTRKLITPEMKIRNIANFHHALTESEQSALKKRLSIVFISRDYPPGHSGGIAIYNKDLANALAALGHTVHVITESHDLNRVDFENGVWVHRMLLQKHDFHMKARKLMVPDQIWEWSATALAEVHRIAENNRIDVIEAPIWDCEGIAFLFDGSFPLVTSLQTTLKFWLDSHPEFAHNTAWMESFGTPMLSVERELMTKAHAIRAGSRAIAADIEKTYGFCFDPLRLIIAHYGLAPRPKSESTKVDNRIEVLFVGRLEHRKGIDVFLKAVPLVLEEEPDVHFRVVGDDTIPSPVGLSYKTVFSESDDGVRHGSSVRFEGKVDGLTLAKAYASCNIFVGPSRYESFGLVFLEAFREEKPVIGCKAGGMPEIIEHGVNGLLVEPGDERALARAILCLVRSPERRRTMGENGRKTFYKRFTATRMAADSLKIFAIAKSNYEVC
jgi:glycosyltransferase involved in cell wall biosynthesis